MQRFGKMAILTALLSAALVVMPAQAGPLNPLTVTFEDSTGPVVATVTAIDNVLLDLDPAVDSVVFIGVVGDIDVNVAVAQSNNGTATDLAFLKINSGSVRNFDTATQTFSIFTSQTDFLSPAGDVRVQSSASLTVDIALPTGAEVGYDFTSYVDPANLLFGTAIPTDTVSLSEPQASSDGANAPDLPVTLPSPYSISNLAVFTIPGTVDPLNPTRFSALGTTNIVPGAVIPGPGGLALALAGLPFVGVWLRRRVK